MEFKDAVLYCYIKNCSQFQDDFISEFSFSIAPPPAPTGGKVGATGLTSAQFLWEAPKYNYKILSYQLQYAKWNSRPQPIITTSEAKTSYLLSGLESGTKYTVKVRAVAVHGVNGSWSVSTTVVTGKDSLNIRFGKLEF